jgi:hypothetical protein
LPVECGDSTGSGGEVLVCATNGCSFRDSPRQNRKAKPSTTANRTHVAAVSAIVHRQDVANLAFSAGTKARAFDRSCAGTGAGSGQSTASDKKAIWLRQCSHFPRWDSTACLAAELNRWSTYPASCCSSGQLGFGRTIDSKVPRENFLGWLSSIAANRSNQLHGHLRFFSAKTCAN